MIKIRESLPKQTLVSFTLEDAKEAVAHLIRAEEDIGKVINEPGAIGALPQGYSHSTYKLVTSTAKLVISIANSPERAEDLKITHKLQHHLYKHDVPVARPLGEVNRFSSHGKIYAVTEWVEGSQPKVWDLTHDQLYGVGKALGQLHSATQHLDAGAYKRPRQPLGTIFSKLWIMGSDLTYAYSRSQSRFPMQAVLRGALKITAKNKNLPHGYNHGDTHPENFIQPPNTPAVPTIIDLGNFYHGPFIGDVMGGMCRLCADQDDVIGHRFSVIKASTFLRGYHDTRPLTPLEMDAIPEGLHAVALRWRFLQSGALRSKRDFHEPGVGNGETVDQVFAQFAELGKVSSHLDIRKMLGIRLVVNGHFVNGNGINGYGITR